MNIDLTGKNALVCGSSSGIGKASAIMLSRMGANITLLARNPDALASALTELHRGPGQEHDFMILDMTHHLELIRLVKGLTNQKRIHILVNNSGGPPAGDLLSADIVSFRHAFEQHVLASHLLVQHLAPGMKEVAWGRIINIISTSVKQPLQGLGVSNTVRAAMANWAKTLATELAPFHITVNNVLPGATATDRLNAIISNKAGKQQLSAEEVTAEMKREIPMGRFASPEEIASAVAFLASPAASFITGTQITVDGGRTGSL